MIPFYPIAFNGSIFLIDKTENRLPNNEIMMSTIPNISSMMILNCIGTASGRIVLVNNVSPSPIAVPISDNIKVCANTILAR